MVINCQDC